MKKRVMIISLITIIMIFSLIIPTIAAMPTYTVGVIVDKTGGVAQEKEIVFTFSLSNFKDFPAQNVTNGIIPQNGIDTVKATLNYDDSTFYPIDINAGGGITTIMTNGDPAIKGLNGWGVTYNPDDNGKKTLVMQGSSFTNSGQDFLQIILKVKAGATPGNTNVSLTDITASDNVNDLVSTNPNGDNGTISQPVTIISSVADATDADPANGFGGYIRIMPDMTVTDFKKFDGKTAFANFKTEQGTSLANTDFIPTGTTASDGTLSYTLIAVCDINADGKLTVTDLSQIRSFEVGSIGAPKNGVPQYDQLSKTQKMACDVAWDGKYTTLDRSQMRLMMVNLGDPQITVWRGTGTATCVPVESQL